MYTEEGVTSPLYPLVKYSLNSFKLSTIQVGNAKKHVPTMYYMSCCLARTFHFCLSINDSFAKYTKPIFVFSIIAKIICITRLILCLSDITVTPF